MDKKEIVREDKILEILSTAYILSCLLMLTCVYHWVGNLLLWLSIYLFGLPLLLFILPVFGLYMFGRKGSIRIGIGFLFSLTPIVYLLPAASNFPFTVQTDAAGHKTTISVGLTLAILLSTFLFLVISTISFYYCQKSYRNKLRSKPYSES